MHMYVGFKLDIQIDYLSLKVFYNTCICMYIALEIDGLGAELNKIEPIVQ